MDKSRIGRSRGASTLEFTLVGIPLIFVLITTIEMSRAMWIYQTLAYAIKEGVRFSAVHGQNCATPPNSCTVTIGQIARVIESAGVGLAGDALSLTFTDAKGVATRCSLNECTRSFNSSAWPPASANALGQKLTISGAYPFTSAMVMFWPGAGRPMNGPPGTLILSADSRETIQN